MFLTKKIKGLLQIRPRKMKLSGDWILDRFPLQYVQRRWQWHFLLGFFFILVGTIGLLAIPLASLSTIRLFALFMLAGGLLQVVEALKAETERQSRMLHLVGGGLYVLGGLLALCNPVASSHALIFLLSVVIFATGACRIVIAMVHKKDFSDWRTVLTSGFESVAIAFLISLAWPYSSLWSLGLFMSAELILNGWGHVVVAFGVGKNLDEIAQPISVSKPELAAV